MNGEGKGGKTKNVALTFSHQKNGLGTEPDSEQTHTYRHNTFTYL